MFYNCFYMSLLFESGKPTVYFAANGAEDRKGPCVFAHLGFGWDAYATEMDATFLSFYSYHVFAIVVLIEEDV